MLDFQLFRVKIFPAAQQSLFPGAPGTRAEILRRAVESLPSAEFRKGILWRVGNFLPIDDTGIYFRLGRSSREKIMVYHDGKFADEEFDMAPYTHCVLDPELSVCAIAKKTRLSPRISGIAAQFAKLLNRSALARELEMEFEIGEIQDPEEFIEYLQRAYAITKFWVTLSRPNPFDADHDFIQPLQKCLDEADGDKGKVELNGKALRSARLEELARSVAATGDDAGARFKPDPEGPPVTKRLRGNVVLVAVEEVDNVEEMMQLLSKVRELYRRIRGRMDARDG